MPSISRPFNLPFWAAWGNVVTLVVAALTVNLEPSYHLMQLKAHMLAGLAVVVMALLVRMRVMTETHHEAVAWWVMTGVLELVGILVIVVGIKG